MATKVAHITHMTPEEKKILTDAAAELAALRASITALTAKLDADATVTDTDYAATCNPATSQFTA